LKWGTWRFQRIDSLSAYSGAEIAQPQRRASRVGVPGETPLPIPRPASLCPLQLNPHHGYQGQVCLSRSHLLAERFVAFRPEWGHRRFRVGHKPEALGVSRRVCHTPRVVSSKVRRARAHVPRAVQPITHITGQPIIKALSGIGFRPR